jgi:hypothetical protein
LQYLFDLLKICKLIKSRKINGADSMLFLMTMIREVVLMKVRDFHGVAI